MERLFERRVFARINADFSGWYALKDEGGQIQGEFWGLILAEAESGSILLKRLLRIKS